MINNSFQFIFSFPACGILIDASILCRKKWTRYVWASRSSVTSWDHKSSPRFVLKISELTFSLQNIQWPLIECSCAATHNSINSRLDFLSKKKWRKTKKNLSDRKKLTFHLIYSLNLHLNKVTATWTTSERVPLCRQDNKLSHRFSCRRLRHVTCVRRWANAA